MNAFFYLSWTSARNRFWFQLRRLRNPRYIVALIVAGAYLWGFLFRPKAAVGSIFLTRPAETIVTLLMALTLAGAWVFGSDTLALAFTPAELSMLFPAPLSRRALIGYKLYRAQIAVLINALIWVFVLRRGGNALPAPLRAIGIWMLFSTLNLHRLGAALVRSALREHGKSGAKRTWWSIAFFVVAALLVIGGLAQQRDKLLASDGIGDFFVRLSDVLSSAPGSIGLLPFHLIVAPTFATTIAAWSAAILPAFILLAAHIWWVLRNDTAFEDAAIEASAERSRRLEAFRGRRAFGSFAAPKTAAGSIKLASAGNPALAIVWKNMLCLRRNSQLRLLIAPTAMSVALGAGMSDGGSDPGMLIAGTAAALCGLLVLFGGRLIRNDLRHDMLHLPMLKALPLSARDLMLAEVASSALPMAVLQFVLILIAFGASLASSNVPVPIEVRIAILAASPFAVLALNGALLTMQNGLAVLFPAWMRLGSTVNTGIEMLGQNLMATLANMFSLVLALIVPLAIAFIAVRYLLVTGTLAIALTIVFASAVLALETYGVLGYLARAFAKAEPASNA